MKLIFFFFTAVVASLFAAENSSTHAPAATSSDRWEPAILAFEEEDRDSPPQPGSIVFYGSSTITGWKTLADDFAGLPVVNRGFGGSRPGDALRYLDRVIVPHQPKTVVLYIGGNDIGSKTPAEISEEVAALVTHLRAALPETKIVLLSLKPTRLRINQAAEVQAVNRHYVALAVAHPNTHYVDLWTPFLDTDGKPDPQWLASDGLHPNRASYRRMAELIRPLLAL
jgi:lysophospholipase L1-like esterase